MIKKFLSLIAAFTLSTLAASAADVWKMYTVQDRYNPTTQKTYTDTTPVVPGETVTFVVEVLNKGSAYNTTTAEGATPTTTGTAWGFVNNGTGFDAAYPTIALSVGGRRDEASIVGVLAAASNGYATALVCEYVVKPGDLARPLKIWDNQFIVTPTIGGTTIGIAGETPAWEDGWVEPVKAASQGAKLESPAEYNSAERNNKTLSGSNIYIEGARFSTPAPEGGSATGTWLSVRANSTELFGGEAAIEITGASASDGASTLYIWSGDTDIINIVGSESVLVPAGTAKTYTGPDMTTVKESPAYKLVFAQGVCRFKLSAKADTYDAVNRKSAKIYVSTMPGMELNNGTTPINAYIEATVDVIAPSKPSVWVRLDGAYERAVTIGSASQPKMTVSLSGSTFDKTVDVDLKVTYNKDTEEDADNPEFIILGTESVKETRNNILSYEFAPGETEKEIYYFVKGVPPGGSFLITPVCTEVDESDCHEAHLIATPAPEIVSVEANGFQSTRPGKATVKITDSERNFTLPEKYNVDWFLNTTDGTPTESKAIFDNGVITVENLTYQLPGTYTSRVVITTPDGVKVSEEVTVVVSELTIARLVRLDDADFIKPIGEDGNTTMFKIVLEPNPGHSGALYAFFKATEHADLIDDAGLPYAAPGHNGLLITSGETEPFAIKFKDNGINTPTGEPVIETVLYEFGHLDEGVDLEKQVYKTYGVSSTRLVVDNTPAYISQFRIKPNGKTAGTAQAKAVTDATKAYDYEATYTSAIRVVADDKESMELSAYIADVVNDRSSDVLVEWRVLDADGDQAAIYYTYSTPDKGWVKCPYAPEFNFAGAHFVEVRALDKDQIAAYRATSDELVEFLNPGNFDDGVSHTVLEAEDYPFFGNFEGTIPSSRIGFTVSENPGMTVSLDKSASASEDGTYMGWYESNEIHTINITLDSKVTGVSTMEFDVVITPVDDAVTATAKDFAIVGSDVFNKTTVKIGNGKNSTSFQLIAKDGGSSARYRIAVSQKAGYTSTFQDGECLFAIYNKPPVLLVQQGIDTMSAVQAANDLEAEIVATAGIPYTITWVIDDVASDEIDVRWSNSNNPGNPGDLDLANKTWTTTFLSPTKPDGALHRVTVSWKDDDETIYHSFSWNVRVDASKTVTLYPMGPTKGANNEGLNNLYNTVAGKGKGKVFIEGYENNEAFETSHKWKVGNVGEVTIKAEATKADPILGGFDSFFYTWLQVTREEGAAGYTITRAGAPLPDVTGETSIPLPEQTNEDGTYTDTIFEAVFSKEFKPEDNCGDINQDGIPDIFFAKYKFGLFNNGKLEGDDFADVSAYNEDEDYLPIPNELNAVGVIGTTNSWIDTARAFTAKTEIRGYFDGLNLDQEVVVEDTAPITSEKTFFNPENSDLEYWAYMQAVRDELAKQYEIDLDDEKAIDEKIAELAAAWVEIDETRNADDYLRENCKMYLTDWTPENPTDPTKADTDGDGLPDGYEYSIWYRAHVGYIQIENAARIPHKAEGSRYRVDPETKLPAPQKISWREIEAHFNPTVALSTADVYMTDFDCDGLSDWMEYQLGTDPCNCDTDGDGVPDGWEVSMGMNPLNAKDGDGTASNPDGDAMATAKVDVIEVTDGEETVWYVIPVGTTISTMTITGNPELDEEGKPKVDELGNTIYQKITSILYNQTIVGAKFTEKPDRVNIPGTDNLLAVGASLLKPQTYELPKGVKIKPPYTEEEKRTPGQVHDPASIIHDQVYTFYGFDPRTAWYMGDPVTGTLNPRWNSSGPAGRIGLASYGKPEMSKAFTSLDEYGYAFYRIHTQGAKVTDWEQPLNKADNLIGLATNPTSADSDNDGMPDGWELYVGLNPLSPANDPDFNKDNDNDGLTNLQEYLANDSCAAYPNCETIFGKQRSSWLNKHWPTDPNDKDTDGDSIPDGSEAGRFAYSSMVDDSSEVIYRGGGLNPNSIDTDLDGLPDAWESQFAGSAIEVQGDTFNTPGNTIALDMETKKALYPVESQIADGLKGDFTMTRAGGSSLPEGTRFVVRGMDGTYAGDSGTALDPLTGLPGSSDPATGTIRDFDFDHDGLENYQEYLTQAIRGFRYDDAETPLMGRAILWKGDVNIEGTEQLPNIAITGGADLHSITVDNSKIFPVFDYVNPYKFLESMCSEKDNEIIFGPLLEKIMVPENAAMRTVRGRKTIPQLVYKQGVWIVQTDEDGSCAVEDAPAILGTSKYIYIWDNDPETMPIVLRIDEEDEGVSIEGGYDWAKLGYFADPKQTWDAAANFGFKYMLPPNSMKAYYTTLARQFAGDQEKKFDEEFGTKGGFGGARVAATGYVGTSPRDPDSDDDGMDDYYELFHGLNPLFGNIDVIGGKYAGFISAKKNMWTLAHTEKGDELDNGKLFDPINYPWAMGHQECDADGDGLRNFDEAICANMASPTTYHTDPTPRWMTDPRGLLSYVRQYYEFNPDLVTPWNRVDAQTDRYTGDLAKPKGWIASFEQSEGYDTDGDFVSDSSEIIKSTMPSSDPQNPSDPARRQAMYFPGYNSAMMTRSDTVVNAWDSQEIFHTFTVECWVKPDSNALGEDQVVFERSHWYEAAAKGDTGHYRANFRIGIDAEGQAYGLFDNDISKASGEDLIGSTQLITGPVLAKDAWSHVAMTFDGKALKLFINGDLKKTVRPSADGAQTLIPANGVTAIIKNPTADGYPLGTATEMSGAFVLGATMTDAWHESKSINSLGKFYAGFVDEVRVWDGARTDAEIELNYMTRFGKAEVVANRDAVYEAWKSGATRNDNDGKANLPAELKASWSFDQMPAAISDADVATTPAGFIKNVVEQAVWADVGVPLPLFNVAWYERAFEEDALTTVYCAGIKAVDGSFACPTLPSAKNIAQQLPDFAGMLPDSHYWSQYISGMKTASDNAVGTYTIPNTMNPYTDAVVLGTRVLPYWRLLRFANITDSEELKELARKHRFHSRSMFSSTTELYPLGGAYAKLDTEMWDNQGPSDAWVDTGKNDAGLLAPEWWVAMKGGVNGNYYTSTAPQKIIEDYLRDIAAGMQPDGSTNKDYAAKSDVNTNGIPDWWESLYGLDGTTYDTDKDGLPDYIEYYVSEVLAKNLNLANFRLDPNNQLSDGLTLDYFRKLGDLYLGEVFTDHDQMDDVWENQYDTSKVSRYVYDPNNDPDMDGWSNYAEYRADTDPTKFQKTEIFDIKLKQFPIPAVNVEIRSEEDLDDSSALIIQARSSNSKYIDYDASWTVGGTDSEATSSSSKDEKTSDMQLFLGMIKGGERVINLEGGNVTKGSVKIDIYDPSMAQAPYGSDNWLYLEDPYWVSAGIEDSFHEDGKTGDIIDFDGTIVGSIEYESGTITLNPSRFIPVQYKNYDPKNESTTVGVIETKLTRDGSYFRINWDKSNDFGGKINTLRLGSANVGYLKEGKNDFIAFLDLNGDGKYTPGEPFGASNGVDVGWNSAKVSISLTKTNPLFPRFEIMSGENDRDYWYGALATPSTSQNTTTTEDGTEVTYTPDATALNGHLVRVRVIRDSTDIGPFTKDKQVAIFDKYVNIDKRDYLNEGDILKDGQFDLDWDNAGEIFTGTTDFGQINYLVVVGENGEYTNSNRIVRYYDTKAANGRKSATNLKDVHCYGARPTFSWMMRPARDSNIEFNTYTAFSVKILKGSEVIYDSGCQKMPAVDQEGYYNWTAPVSFGDIVRGALQYSVLPYSGEFTWRISIYNSKFKDDSVYAEAKLSASVESEGNFLEGHGYGALAVTVRYAGPASLLAKVGTVDGKLPKGQVRVEAFETPDFSGEAVSSAFAKKVDGELKAMVCGLEIGKAYYLRAYLDSDGDQKKSAWESWGCTTSSKTVTPVPNEISFYLEDCDTDHDWLPDAWEYAKAGNLSTLGGNEEKTITTYDGLKNLGLQGTLVAAPKLAQQKFLVAPSAQTFATESFVSLLLGTPITVVNGQISGQVVEGSLLITDFAIDGDKVTLTLEAAVGVDTDSAFTALYDITDAAAVTVKVLHKTDLAEDWSVAATANATVGKDAQTIEFTLPESLSPSGFYKLQIEQ